MSCTHCDCKDRYADTDEWVTLKRPAKDAEPADGEAAFRDRVVIRNLRAKGFDVTARAEQ